MKLIYNVKLILLKAWSVRLLAFLIILELVGVWLTVRGVFSNNEKLALYFQLSGALLSIAAFIARITYQKGVSNEHK